MRAGLDRALVASRDRGSDASRAYRAALRRRDRRLGCRLGAPRSSSPTTGRAAGRVARPTSSALVVLELSVPLWLERKRHAPAGTRITSPNATDCSRSSCSANASSPRRRRSRPRSKAGGVSAALVTISVAGLVVVFALWWLYFLEPAGEGLARNPDRAVLWGCFGQYGVFAALAGLGAGLEVADRTDRQPDPVVASRRELRGCDSGRTVPRAAVGGLVDHRRPFGRSDPS